MNEPAHHSAISAVTVSGVSKRYGFTSALHDITLTLAQGEFLALFGPNGAGKTTLLHILSTLISPTAGNVQIFGYDLAQDGAVIRQRIGVLSHLPFLVPTLTGYENLRFYGKMFGIEPLKERIERLLNEVGMFAYRDRLVETFSRGMLQRLALARALLHAPQLLLLDEPYTGLDQEGAAFLRQTLQRLRNEGRTLIMTCHDFEQGLEFCTTAAILKNGQLAYYGEPATMHEPFEAIYRRCTT